jgi:hypothetical protein
MLDVRFDLRRIEMNERSLTEAFAYKQLGARDMIRRHCGVSGPLRDSYFVARQIGDILAIAIPIADTADVADVIGIAMRR